MSEFWVSPRFKIGDRVRIIRPDLPFNNQIAVVLNIDTAGRIPRYDLEFGRRHRIRLLDTDVAAAPRES